MHRHLRHLTAVRTITVLGMTILVVLAATTGLAAASSAQLMLGVQGQEVASLQRELAGVGHDPGPIDGLFGPRTREAVLSFQRAADIGVDGIAGPQTLGRLREAAQLPARAERARADLPLVGRVIVLDPGHGGPSGARGPSGSWEDYNVLAIARYARDLLVDAGATVVLTREGNDRPRDPTKPSAGQLEARARIGNRSGADVFISIHNNWNWNRNIRGMATYYRPSAGATTTRLARTLQQSVVVATGMRDIGLISGNFYVLRNTRMTSVLLEIGFMSNPEEERLLQTEQFRRKAAEGVYRGLLRHYGVDEPLPARSGEVRPRVDRIGDPIVFGYWAQWGAEPEPRQSVAANIDRLDFVAPYWYTALGDGSLRSRETDHEWLRQLVKEQGRGMLVMVNNDKTTTAMLTNDSSRRRLAQSIISLVLNNGYAGVNIDFEDLRPHHRSQLTSLVAEVAGGLRPHGKLTTVAVGAKWSADESTNDWAAAYDYSALAGHADYLVIMAYDQHGSWRGPGPIASIQWVRSIVDYAVARVPPRQILLGIAAYGYEWAGGKVQQVVTADQAVALANRHGATIRWDDAAQVPMFRYQSGGTAREVWFENSFSASQKLRLAKEYGLAGIALWKLGYEDTRLWEVIDKELHGR